MSATVPARWGVGDAVYGSDGKLRRALEAWGQAYALAVQSTEQPTTWPPYAPPGQVAVADRAAALEPDRWQRLSCGDGARGERPYARAYVPARPALRDGWVHAVVIRRDLNDLDQVAYSLVYAPTGPPLTEIVRAIGARWTVEDVFKLAKRQVGLDQYEVRSWTGWHRHTPLALLALVLGPAKGDAPSDPDLVPISIPELRRLMTRLPPGYPQPARFVLAWSRWRRHHQAIARACHIKRRRQRLDRNGSL